MCNKHVQKSQIWPQYLTSLSTVLVTFCAGIHYGWPTPSLPVLFSKENFTSLQASYVVTTASFGDIVGNIVFTLFADCYGRKTTILLIGLPQMISMFLIFLGSDSFIFLLIARFFGGIGEGACLCVVAIYIGEISEPRIRGILISFFSISWSSGCLFINIVGSYNSIKSASLITLIFPFIFLISFSFVPESPYYLLMKNNITEARKSLKKLRRNEDIEEELCKLQRDVGRQMSEKGRYKDLFVIRTNRNALLIMMSVIAISEFSGISSLTFYGQIFFLKTTVLLPQQWASSLIIFLQLIFGIISSFSIDFIGRRPLLLSSISGCASSLILLCIYFLLHDYSSFDFSHFDFIPLASVILFVIFFNFGVANVVNCLNGELFSTSVKTKAACVSAIWYSLCVVVVNRIYQILSDSYSLGVPFFVFAVVEIFGWIFVWKCVPETKGKTLEEIQREIKGMNPSEDRQPLLQQK